MKMAKTEFIGRSQYKKDQNQPDEPTEVGENVMN
jgi:hypothetical protein